MRLYRAFVPKFLLIVFALVLVGCSALRLGYSNGESVAYWWLNGYVGFESEQSSWVKKRIDRFFVWHRATQLDAYAQLLADSRQQLNGQVTPANVQAKFDAIERSALLLADHALPDLADLALSLQPHQIAHIEKKFASNNERYRKEYLRGDLEQRQLARYKKVMKQAEYWFGDFSEAQKAQIRAASDARPLRDESMLEMRMRRQREMIALLKKVQSEKPAREAVVAMLKDYVTAASIQFGDAGHRTAFAEARGESANLVTQIIRLATPAQKAHAAERLQRLIDDCRALAG